jgi:biotin operon repressor
MVFWLRLWSKVCSGSMPDLWRSPGVETVLKDPLVVFSLSELAALKGFTSLSDVRVLVAALEKVGHDNIIFGTQSEIAGDLGMSRQSVNRSFKSLCARGILLKASANGAELHRLNPTFGSKATQKKLGEEK